MTTPARPMSPHLQIYKWQITMLMSILHRGTGVVLSIGAIGLVAWLVAVAMGGDAFTHAQACAGSVIGQIFLAGWTFALFYHLCNGVRHLFWDAGKGFSMEGLYKGGYITFAVAILLTAATWAAILLGVAS